MSRGKRVVYISTLRTPRIGAGWGDGRQNEKTKSHLFQLGEHVLSVHYVGGTVCCLQEIGMNRISWGL